MIEITEIKTTKHPDLVKKETSVNHTTAIRALKEGYVPFAPHAEKYPYLGYLYRDQIGPFGLTIVDQNDRTIFEPISDVINLGLPRKDQAKLEEAKASGLFDAFMAASSCHGPFDKKTPYWPQRLALVAYIGVKQPLRFGQYTYGNKALPPQYIALNGMGFVIST